MEKVRKERPTWAMVRDLESRLASQVEGTSRLVHDCDLWREKYRALVGKTETLAQSNRLMEDEVVLLRSRCASLEDSVESLSVEKARLERRGLWSRLFNR